MVDSRKPRAAMWAVIAAMMVLGAALSLEAQARAAAGIDGESRTARQAAASDADLVAESDASEGPRAMRPVTTTTTASPTPGPSPTPTRCPKWYEIRVHIFADNAGVGIPDQPCPGCDGHYTTADKLAAGYCKLDSAWVVVYPAGQPHMIIADEVMKRKPNELDMVHSFYVCQPPPHVVKLVTANMTCLRLCPNFSSTRRIEQEDYDKSYGGSYVSEVFPFWSCTLPWGTPTASPSPRPWPTPTRTITPQTTPETTPETTPGATASTSPATTSATAPTATRTRTPLATVTPTVPLHTPSVATETPWPTATSTESILRERVWLPYATRVSS